MEVLIGIIFALLLVGVLVLIVSMGMALIPVLAVALLVAFFYILGKSIINWWSDL